MIRSPQYRWSIYWTRRRLIPIVLIDLYDGWRQWRAMIFGLLENQYICWRISKVLHHREGRMWKCECSILLLYSDVMSNNVAIIWVEMAQIWVACSIACCLETFSEWTSFFCLVKIGLYFLDSCRVCLLRCRIHTVISLSYYLDILSSWVNLEKVFNSKKYLLQHILKIITTHLIEALYGLTTA